MLCSDEACRAVSHLRWHKDIVRACAVYTDCTFDAQDPPPVQPLRAHIWQPVRTACARTCAHRGKAGGVQDLRLRFPAPLEPAEAPAEARRSAAARVHQMPACILCASQSHGAHAHSHGRVAVPLWDVRQTILYQEQPHGLTACFCRYRVLSQSCIFCTLARNLRKTC